MKRFAASERSRDVVALAALAGIIIVLFSDVLFWGADFFRRDFAAYYWPVKYVVREVVRGGGFPFWNPMYSGGQPLAANPEHELFYPLTWITFFFDYEVALRAFVMVHFFIVSAGTFALLRSLRSSRLVALFGALAMVIGGVWLSLIHLLPCLLIVTWIPLILLFLIRCLEHPNRRDFAITALLIGIQSLAGEPITLVHSWILYVTCALAYGTQLPAVRRLGLVVLLILGGFAVSAVQLLPAFDLARDSIRSQGFDYEMVTTWSMPLVRPLELAWPHMLGHLDDDGGSYSGAARYPSTRSPFVYRIYFGMLPCVLILAGLLTMPRRAWPLAGFVSGSLVLAAGGNTPLFRGLFGLGLATSFRFPEKFLIVPVIVLTIVAGVLLQRAVEGDRRLALMALRVALGIAVVSEACALWLRDPRDWLFSVLFALLAAGWIAGLSRWRDRREWLVLAIAILLLDLAPAIGEIAPRMPREFWQAPQLLSSLDPAHSTYRLFPEASLNGDSADAGVFLSGGDTVYWIRRNGLFPMTPGRYGIRTVLDGDYDRTALLPTHDFVQAFYEVQKSGAPWAREGFMAMAGARYVTVYRDARRELRRARSIEDVKPVDVVDMGARPSVYFADQIVAIRDARQFVAAWKARPWSPRVAFVGTRALRPGKGTVDSLSTTSQSMTVAVHADAAALLVLAVTPHKYWRAQLDGAPVACQVVNLGFQGVIVPAGAHIVTLRYRNDLIIALGTTSLVATALLLAFALWNHRAGEAVVSPVPRSSSKEKV